MRSGVSPTVLSARRSDSSPISTGVDAIVESVVDGMSDSVEARVQ